ncbi:MAG: type II secretion system protein, partial [Planctomycetota bacterium]
MINPVGSRVIYYRSLTVMHYRNSKIRSSRALTLVEMLIAMAIMAIVFSAVVPQFRVIQNSWDSKQAASET